MKKILADAAQCEASSAIIILITDDGVPTSWLTEINRYEAAGILMELAQYVLGDDDAE